MLSGNESIPVLIRLGLLVGGSLVLLLLTRIPAFDAVISWVIRKSLKENIRLYRKDYDSLLFLSGDFEIVKARIK